MNGAVQIFPYQSVMLNILDEIFLGYLSRCQVFNSVNWNYSNVLDGSKQIFESDQVPEIVWLLFKPNQFWFSLPLYSFLIVNIFIYLILPPNSGFVCWFDFVVQVIQDDIIDKLVPSQNWRYLIETTFSYFNPGIKEIY